AGYTWGVRPASRAVARLELGAGDAGVIALGMGTGAWLGAWASLGAAGTGTRSQLVAASVLGGQALGYLAGTVAAANVELTPTRSARLATGGLLGAAVTSGIALAARPPREPNPGGFGLTVDAGTLAGFALAAALPQALAFGKDRAGVMAGASLYGAAAGGLFALADPDYDRVGHAGQRHFGGALAGASLGLLGGAVLAPSLSPTPATLRVGLGTTAAATIGSVGLGLWGCRLRDSPATCDVRGRTVRFGEVGAALGVATGLAFADRLPATPAAASNALAGALWGAWHGVLLARLDERASAVTMSGEAMALGATTGAGLYLASGAWHLDAPVGWALVGGTVLGNAYGAGLAYLWPERNGRQRATFTLTAPYALAALGLAAVPLYGTAPQPSGTRLALGLALGAWHGQLLPDVWQPGAADRTARRLGGTTVGGLTGLILSAASEPLVADSDVVEATLAATLGNVLGYGLGELDAAAGPVRQRRYQLDVGLGLALAGAVAGRTTQYDREITGWALALGAVGGWHAAFSQASGMQLQETRALRGALLVGASAGILGGAALGQWYAPSPGDSVEMLVLSGLGNALALGAAHAGARRDDSTRRWMLGTGLGGALAGALVAPHTRYGADDVTLFALATGLGATSGWVATGAWHRWPLPNGERTDIEWRMRRGAALAGASTALVVGAGLTQRWALAPGDAFEVAYAFGAGNALGYGVGGLIDPTQPKLRAQTQLGGAALATLSAALAYDKTTYSSTDFGLAVLALGIGTWHGQLGRTRVPEADAGDDPTLTLGRARYASVLAAGLGSLGAMGLAQVVDYGWGDLGEVALGSIAGNALGLGISLMREPRSGERRVLAQHIAGLGLAGASLVAAPLTHYDTADTATFVLASSLGAALGSWTPALWHERPLAREHSGGALTGASAGAIGAALASQWLGVTPSEGGGIAFGLGTLAAMGDGVARLGFDDERSTTRARIALGSAVGFGVAGGVVSPWLLRLAQEDAALVAVGGAWGAAQAAWLSDLIGPEGTSRRRVASLELGIPVGAAGMGVLLQRLALTRADGAELITGVLLGQVGGYAVARLGDRDARTRALGAELGGLGGTLLGLVLAPHLSYHPAALFYTGVSASVGAVYGAQLATQQRRAEDAGALLGLSLGALASGLAAPTLALAPHDTLESAATAGLAHLFVDRTVHLMGLDPRTRRLSTTFAGLGGFVAGSLLTPSTHYRGGDFGLMALSTGLGAVSGYHAATLLDTEAGTASAAHRDGLALGGSLGMLAGATLAQSLQLQSAVIARAAAGGVIGNVLGWGVGQLAYPQDREATTALGMGVGGLSLAVGGGLFGDRLSLSSGNAGMVGLLAVTGAWHGAWLSRSWNDTDVDDTVRRQLGGGALLGTGAGVLTGAVFSSALAYSAGDVAESA
ncbi:MAG: hypothetical protein AAB426_12545, partial [Myxococcota bacterium]